MVSQKIAWLILVLLVALAASLRLVGLTHNPPGFNWDEVSHGYNAYSLLHTGRDQWNQILPLFNFRAYGDYPTTLNLYLSVLPIWLFGPTDFALRLPHALVGVLTVVFGYIAAVRWRKHRLLGLIVAFLFTFSPWTFFLSRQVLQANWAICLLTLGLAYYFSNLPVLAVLTWGLSLFAYHNTRIFVPLLLIFLLPKKSFRSNKTILAVLLGVVVLTGGILWSSPSRARGGWVGILDQGAVAHIEQLRNTSPLPALASRLIFNRPVYMLTNIAKNYLGYFSPRFLFFSGGTQYQFSLPGFGVLNPLFLPFFYLGIYQLYRRHHWFLLLWLILSPLPAAITRDQYAVVRATTMIPAVLLTCALGLIWLVTFLKPLLRITIFLTLLVGYAYFSYSYFHSYIYKYPWFYSQSWQYPNKAMVELAKQYFPEYDQILITKRYGEPHEFLLWYWPWNPAAYQTDQSLQWNFHDNWYWVDGFSKFRFVNDWELQDLAKTLPHGKRYLIISSADSEPDGAKIGQINFLDGTPAYLLRAI